MNDWVESHAAENDGQNWVSCDFVDREGQNVWSMCGGDVWLICIASRLT